MSYLGSQVFSDVVKDVIGNEPVLDQFDIDYDASFFGTMQDDYVTGTMLSREKGFFKQKQKVLFTVGTRPRGRVFSKYYAESQPALESTFGSKAVTQNPSLAFRLVPWHERVSHTSYRTSQFFDESERYYDSCLPDIVKCFAADGAALWTPETEADEGWLSPYRNVVTGGIGHLFFNTYPYGNLVDNDWTWAYPYEAKYSPLERKVTLNAFLDLGDITTKVIGYPGVNLNLTSGAKRQARGFIPLLAGKHGPEDMDATARNSLRTFYKANGLLGTISQMPAAYSSSFFDGEYGYSFMIPADIKLDQQMSHGYLSSYSWVTNIPSAEYVTASMTPNDTIKFLFGFGDLNNMTYGYRQFISGNTTSSYTERFETANVAANSLGKTYDDGSLSMDWSRSTTYNGWNTRAKNSSNDYVDASNYFKGGKTAKYHYLTGSNAAGPTKGIYWLSSSSPSNLGVLVSDTNGVYNGGLTDPSLPNSVTSSCCVDVTSSYPWHLRYKRAVACHESDGLRVYFAGIPGKPSGEHAASGLGIITTIEVITGSGTGATGGASAESIGLLKQYDSRIQGIGDDESQEYNAPAYAYPFDPGAYRIVFSYFLSEGSATIGDPSVAIVDDVEIVQLKEDAFPPDYSGQKLGCNNYPEFRKQRADKRYNPILGYNQSYSPSQVTGSSDHYSGYNFGISPVIRGWKYGLHNGFPTYSKAVFRRNSFGQLRDMLEQRQYTKFIKLKTGPCDNEAVVINDFSKLDSDYSLYAGGIQQIEPAAVEVKFVRRAINVDEKGLGFIYVVPVQPSGTVSMNLSTEVTSSQPYFDGHVKLRESKLGTSYGSQVFVTNYP